MHKTLPAIAVPALSAAALAQAATLRPTVATWDGVRQGKMENEANAFLGIPFGKPPVGERSWRAPEKPEGWSGLCDATHFGASCYRAPARRFGPSTAEFTTEALSFGLTYTYAGYIEGYE